MRLGPRGELKAGGAEGGVVHRTQLDPSSITCCPWPQQVIYCLHVILHPERSCSGACPRGLCLCSKGSRFTLPLRAGLPQCLRAPFTPPTPRERHLQALGISNGFI